MSEHGQHKLPRLFRVLSDREMTHFPVGANRYDTPFGIIREGEIFYVVELKQRRNTDGPYDVFGVTQEGKCGWISYGGTVRGLFGLILGDLEDESDSNGSET